MISPPNCNKLGAGNDDFKLYRCFKKYKIIIKTRYFVCTKNNTLR